MTACIATRRGKWKSTYRIAETVKIMENLIEEKEKL